MAKSMNGINLAINTIMVLGVGLGVAQGVITAGNYTGLTSTVITYVPLMIVAGYLYYIAKQSGAAKGN